MYENESPPVQLSLLSEVERQQYYLGRLPDKYDFPLFSGRQAVESQRKSGYKTTARAAREVIDNAIEAGADNVWVALDRVPDTERQKGEWKDAVRAVAFIDDGPGMLPDMARLALSWGGGTHADDPSFIGKFGFGLPNSGINQTRRVEVFTKTEDQTNWHRAVLDINEVPAFGLVSVPPTEKAELPEFVEAFMERKGIHLDSGVVVLWDRPDRLTYKTASHLKEHLMEDFGVVYRYLLGDRKLYVEDWEVQPTDPMFLMRDARFFVEEEDGGAVNSFDETILVKFSYSAATGAPHLEILATPEDLKAAREAPDVVAVGRIQMRVARFPVGFLEGSKKKNRTDAGKRFKIRKPRRGISFVRANREIDTIMVLPDDPGSGLGNWPLLQAYAYHWAAEVRFGAELDEAFGIGNDKQTVAPMEDVWRVLHEAELDTALSHEQSWQKAARKKEKEETNKKALESEDGDPSLDVVAQTEAVLGKATEPEERKTERKLKLGKGRDELKEQKGVSDDEAGQILEEQAKRRPFAIRFFDAPGGVFYRPSIGNGLQKIVEINTAHAFYKYFYSGLLDPSVPLESRLPVNLLLFALAVAELKADEEQRDFYEDQRPHEWSRFLGTALKIAHKVTDAGEVDDINDA